MGALEVIKSIVTVLLLAGLVAAIQMIRSVIRSKPDSPLARFEDYWNGALGGQLFLFNCTGLAFMLGVCGMDSIVGIVAAVAINLVMQPIALFMCWIALGNVLVSLRGRVAWGGHAVPEAELGDMSVPLRRGMILYGFMRGAVGFPLGVVVSLASAFPFLRLFGG